MHFRSRNKVVQVIRTSYDAESKKPKAAVLGTLKKGNPEIGDELRLSCTPTELAEVQSWIKNQHQVARLELELATRNLVSQMEKAMEWFDTTTPSIETAGLAANILGNLPKLRSQLQKHMAKD